MRNMIHLFSNKKKIEKENGIDSNNEILLSRSEGIKGVLCMIYLKKGGIGLRDGIFT